MKRGKQIQISLLTTVLLTCGSGDESTRRMQLGDQK